jgi:hypothetical protein
MTPRPGLGYVVVASMFFLSQDLAEAAAVA